jgi:hypothetical protein
MQMKTARLCAADQKSASRVRNLDSRFLVQQNNVPGIRMRHDSGASNVAGMKLIA